MEAPRNPEPDPRRLIGTQDDPVAVPCSLVHDLLPARVGGELEPQTEQVLARHLAECLSCARLWRGHEQSHEALLAHAEVLERSGQFGDEFFSDLHQGIVGRLQRSAQVVVDTEQLNEQLGEHRGGWRRAGGRVWAARLAGLAATLCAGFFIGQSLLPGGGDTVPPAARDVRQVLSDPEFRRYLIEKMLEFAGSRPVTEGLVYATNEPARALGKDESDF